MAYFKVHFLGCGSACPTLFHQPSCQVVEYRDRLYMVDCGEGAQTQMRRMRLKFSRLGHIFISHLHGDHFLGLPGLLSTLSLLQVSGSVTIHIFKEGAELIKTIMSAVCRDTSFEIKYDIISPEGGETVYEDNNLIITTFPLYHRVPCVGYLFREKPKSRHLNSQMLDFYKVPVKDRPLIREGADFITEDGLTVANERLTRPADPALSYAYCSDTAYNPRVAVSVKGVDTLYHEATYLAEYETKASARGHSTARQAAMTAAAAGARRLVMGHYSKRYEDTGAFEAEASEIFPNSIAATEGMTIEMI
ncbi:MAG: ribonuclease Z [Muribaculaceae bacterium]|nr:ribonuclease Z [Muribaculaceae bacterium]